MKILIIGLGSIAAKHISAIRVLVPESEIFALRSSGSGNSVQGVTDISDLNQLKVDLDFIIIANPTFLHAETIRQCLRLNKPLFIEKPLFKDIDNNDDILDLIHENKLPTYIACNLRFHPVIRYIKTQLDQGTRRINEVNIYCGSFLPDWRPASDFRKGYSANPEMGGGVQLDLIHEIDYAWWFFGKPMKVNSLKRNVSGLTIPAIDFAAYHLLYPGFTVNIVLNYYRRIPKRTVEIVFEDGIWNGDLLTGKVFDEKGIMINETVAFSMMNTYTDQMKYFLSGLQSSDISMNTIDEAYEVLKIALHEETAG